jgi:hypothetical protein
MPLTVDYIRGLELEHVRHIIDRGPRGNFFTEITSPMGQPRFQRFRTTYSRLGVPEELIWVADGTFRGTIDEAVAWVNQHPMPEVSQLELATLDLISEKYAPSPTAPINLESLWLKGLVEYDPASGRRCRRTPLAKKVLCHAG